VGGSATRAGLAASHPRTVVAPPVQWEEVQLGRGSPPHIRGRCSSSRTVGGSATRARGSGRSGAGVRAPRRGPLHFLPCSGRKCDRGPWRPSGCVR
jgi:hypothetical protein